MEENQYIELLDKAYADLPAVLYKKERFEIPKASGRIERTKTIVKNFRDIAKHFARSEMHVSRFFLKDLGVRGEVTQRGELELASIFQPGSLNKTIEKYYDLFVKCPKCSGPDTILNEATGEMQCKICGSTTKIAN